MDVKVGLRVVRGPDWKWGAQDGGEGHVGTVVEVKTSEAPEEGHETARAVLVQWDNGNRCNYRCGLESKYDLLLFDNGQAAVKHTNIICDVCRQNGIEGMRWKCQGCPDFDLCTSCYMSAKHLQHTFMRKDTPTSPFVKLGERNDLTRILAKGIFKGAEVVRGQDWLWADQDGGDGNIGHVIDVRRWEEDTFRSVAEIEWDKIGKKNLYRVGHKGKVDLKAKVAASGGLYYPDHLPILGKPVEVSDIVDNNSKKSDISVGDQVRVELDVEIFKALQAGHGGWNDKMAQILEQVGEVQSVLEFGDLRILFPDSCTYTINPAAVTKVARFSTGDVIKVIDDMSLVHDLQENHGGWVDDMALSLGQAGRVINVFGSGDVRVSVNGRNWTFNPLCIRLAPDENPSEAIPDSDLMPGGIEGDIEMQLRLLSLMENPAVVVAAAAAHDVDQMRDFLKKHPTEVNTKAAGKAAIHCAAVAGNINIIKCLLEFNANLEIEDEDGDKPLHLCAYGDEEEAAKLLLEKGADINGRNRRGLTPLMFAALKGHTSTMKVFIQQPNIDFRAQDSEGNTALHLAVLAQKNEAVSILLEAGADPDLVNFRLFTPVHDAARIGFLPGMEQFIKRDPTCVNRQKDDGFTPLHLASLNNHLDLVTVIAETEVCDIDCRHNNDGTPLHIAIQQGHAAIIERLIGFGANLNAQDSDGDTPLHIVIVRDSSDPISSDTPQLKKLKDSLCNGDSEVDGNVLLACFLLQEGADLYLLNNKGATPLFLCKDKSAAAITKFYDKKDEYVSNFHGSLRRSVPASTQQQATPTAPAVTKPLPTKSLPLTTSPSLPPVTQRHSSAPSTTATTECFICDKEADIKLKPCGHVVICKLCSERTKKCPECRVKVEGIEEIPKLVMCLMCEEEPAVVTMSPCNHQFCMECSRRMRKCGECKTPIESKIGLIDDDNVTPGNISITTSLTTCEICCENPRNTVLTCGHQFCFQCSHKVDQCPVCRKVIQHRIQLFQ